MMLKVGDAVGLCRRASSSAAITSCQATCLQRRERRAQVGSCLDSDAARILCMIKSRSDQLGVMLLTAGQVLIHTGCEPPFDGNRWWTSLQHWL